MGFLYYNSISQFDDSGYFIFIFGMNEEVEGTNRVFFFAFLCVVGN